MSGPLGAPTQVRSLLHWGGTRLRDEHSSSRFAVAYSGGGGSHTKAGQSELVVDCSLRVRGSSPSRCPCSARRSTFLWSYLFSFHSSPSITTIRPTTTVSHAAVSPGAARYPNPRFPVPPVATLSISTSRTGSSFSFLWFPLLLPTARFTTAKAASVATKTSRAKRLTGDAKRIDERAWKTWRSCSAACPRPGSSGRTPGWRDSR